MQKVFLWSSLTYEWTHVTPSSAFVPTTDRQASAPLSVMGISRPSGNVRSTMKRAIATSSLPCGGTSAASAIEPRFGPLPFHPREGSRGTQSRCSFSRYPRRHLHARVEAQLGQDVADVVVDSALGQEEPLGDLAIA